MKWHKDKTYIADIVSEKTLTQISKVYRKIGSDIFHRQRKTSERKSQLEKRWS